MKVKIFEVAESQLSKWYGSSNIMFHGTKETQDILANYPYSIHGICMLTFSSGDVNIYKFYFSCIGLDGVIEPVCEQFKLEKRVVKSCIVDFAVELVKNKKGV